jgi:hypothetical protein
VYGEYTFDSRFKDVKGEFIAEAVENRNIISAQLLDNPVASPKWTNS